MALRDLLDQIKTKAVEGALPAIRGAGVGATLGLVKPASAGLMYAIDRLMGEGKLTMSEAMQLINEQQAADRAQQPIASYGGEAVGSLLPAITGGGAIANIARIGGRGLAPAATRIGGQAAIGAGQGGIAAYNENQDLGEAALGAAVGAPLALLGQGGQAGVNALVRRSAQNVAREREQSAIASALQARQQIDSLLSKPRLTPSEIKLVQRLKKRESGYVQSANTGAEAVKTLQDRALTDAQALELAGTSSQMMKDVIGNTIGPRSMGANFGAIGLGALGGAGIGSMLGNPELGALLGAAGGGTVPKLKLASLAKVPQSLAPAAGLATSQAARMGATALPKAEEDFSQYFQPEGEQEDFGQYFK